MAAFMYDVVAGNGTGAWVATAFQYAGAAMTAKSVTLKCWDNPLYVQFSYDHGATWGDTIEVDETNPPIPYFIAATDVRVMNVVALSVSRFQIVAVGG